MLKWKIASASACSLKQDNAAMVHEGPVSSSDLPFNSTVVQHSTTEESFTLEAQMLHIVESSCESVGKELQQCVVLVVCSLLAQGFGYLSVFNMNL